MANLKAILRTIDELTPEERQKIVEYIQRRSEPGKQPRVVGLHAGAIQMSDDFDEALPDEFWLDEK